MGDSVDGQVGESGEGVAVGKGVQQVILNLGDRTPHEITNILDALPRIGAIVLGDGMRWAGIVNELQRLEEKIVRLSQQFEELQDRMGEMEGRAGEARSSRRQQFALIVALLTLVIIGIVIQLLNT